MHKIWSGIKIVLLAAYKAFGVIVLLFVIRAWALGENSVLLYELWAAVLCALGLGLLHTFAFTDTILPVLPEKARVWISLPFCAAIGGYLCYVLGLTSLLGLHDGYHTSSAGVFDWWVSMGMAAVVLIGVWLLVELGMRRMNEKYGKALSVYKGSERK